MASQEGCYRLRTEGQTNVEVEMVFYRDAFKPTFFNRVSVPTWVLERITQVIPRFFWTLDSKDIISKYVLQKYIQIIKCPCSLFYWCQSIIDKLKSIVFFENTNFPNIKSKAILFLYQRWSKIYHMLLFVNFDLPWSPSNSVY